MKFYVKEEVPVRVIFIDNQILVVLKPAGVVTQSEEGLEGEAKEWIKKSYSKKGAVFLVPIHRLDKCVSGLVLFARTSKALSRLQEQMRNRQIEKNYSALVSGVPNPIEATLEHFLIHDEFRARIAAPPAGKQALLHYRLLSTNNGISQLYITLLTGRYHQIRAQLSTIGLPILGDVKYGSRHPFAGGGGIALHHSRMKFMHPTLKQEVVFEAPSPWQKENGL
jgi:23S rRNA pseudouridine1911/1915/1917 synthase